METIKNHASRVGFALGIAGLMVLGSAGLASAQTADPVSDAFTDMQGKVTLYGGMIVGLVVLATAIFLGIKYLSKGVGKA